MDAEFDPTITFAGDSPRFFLRSPGGSGHPTYPHPHVELEPQPASGPGGSSYFTLPDLNDLIDKATAARDALRVAVST